MTVAVGAVGAGEVATGAGSVWATVRTGGGVNGRWKASSSASPNGSSLPRKSSTGAETGAVGAGAGLDTGAVTAGAGAAAIGAGAEGATCWATGWVGCVIVRSVMVTPAGGVFERVGEVGAEAVDGWVGWT